MITDASNDCFLVCFISREEKRLLRGGETLTEVPGQCKIWNCKGGGTRPGKKEVGRSWGKVGVGAPFPTGRHHYPLTIRILSQYKHLTHIHTCMFESSQEITKTNTFKHFFYRCFKHVNIK